MWVRGHSRSLKIVPFESFGTVSYSPSIGTMAISLAISEIISVKQLSDLEIWVWGHSRSLKLMPFKSLGAVSYSPSIITMPSARYSDLLVENREIFIPHLYSATPRGWPRRNFVKMFDAGKTRMIGLPYGEINYDNMLSRFHLILPISDLFQRFPLLQVTLTSARYLSLRFSPES